MTAAKRKELVTEADYLAGEVTSDVKHEYTGGYVYAMAGASNVHNRIAGNAFATLHGQLLEGPCEPFNSDTKVRIDMATHTRFYYPDCMVVCHPSPGETSYQEHPVVIVEVLSPATRRLDEREKRDAYFAVPSVTTYLLVEIDQPQVVVHRRTGDGIIAEMYEGLDAVISLSGVEASVSLADLYRRVDFDNLKS